MHKKTHPHHEPAEKDPETTEASKPAPTFLSYTLGQWIAGVLLTLVCAVGLVLGGRQIAKMVMEPPPKPAGINPVTLAPDALRAQAAVVYDLTDGRMLYTKNEEVQLPLASLTKLMTTDTILDLSSATNTVQVSAAAVATEGDSGIRAGSAWKLDALLKYALTVSSNDAMAAVAESGGGKKFIDAMNKKAQSLGLAQSYFLDPTGLDVTQSVSGGYGSALDVAKLAGDVYAKHPGIFESTIRPNITYSGTDDAVHGTPTAAPILDIPGLIGAKTGYTDLAGGNLVAVFDLSVGHPAAAVVLHSTQSGRFEDMRTLITAARVAQ